MSTVSDLLNSAIPLHRGGRLDEARAIYEQVLARDPRQPDALNLLGLLERQNGRFAEAASHLERAIAVDPSQSAFHANLGEAYRGLGRLDEAIACYEQAVRRQPTAAVAQFQLGTLYDQRGRIDEAIACYRRTVELEPVECDARCTLAQALERAGRLAEAAEAYEAALEINAQHVPTLVHLGELRKRIGHLAGAEVCFRLAIAAQPALAEAHFELGNVHQMEGRLAEAIAAYRRAVELDANFAPALCNLGNALREAGAVEQGLAYLERAVARSGNLAAAHSNLGAALQDLGRLEAAQAAFERAVALEPQRAEFLFNLGTVLKDQGRIDEAIDWYQRALAARPGYGQALCSLATAALAQGRFAEGWAGYEHRLECPQFDTLRLAEPRWDGKPLDERRLLVHCEQGLGDTLQFIRYLPLVRTRARHVTLAAPRALVPLLAQSGYEGLVAKEDPLPAYDVQVPLMSLPHVLGTTLDTVPADVPYLRSDPQRVARWRDELASLAGKRVGIAWQGRKLYRGDSLRSIPLVCFAPLAAVPGVTLISLQKGPGSEQLAALAGRFEVVDLAASLDEGDGGAFVDTAAAMHSLDLVITSDTAIAHLAGALSVRVWVALAHAPDWRWMFERADSPWYPTMRLFRQSRPGAWDEVFARMAEALQEVVRADE
jgi:tetratricopeptide (TPR) repeat protein